MDLEKVLGALADGMMPMMYFIFAIAGLVGVVKVGEVLLQVKNQARHGRSPNLTSAVVAIVFCVLIIALPNFLNISGATLGYGSMTYGVTQVASEGVWGMGAKTINNIIALVRVLGVYFAYSGLAKIANSNLDGHTKISSVEMRGSGIVSVICGVLMAFLPEVLEGGQQTLGLIW